MIEFGAVDCTHWGGKLEEFNICYCATHLWWKCYVNTSCGV